MFVHVLVSVLAIHNADVILIRVVVLASVLVILNVLVMMYVDVIQILVVV